MRSAVRAIPPCSLLVLSIACQGTVETIRAPGASGATGPDAAGGAPVSLDDIGAIASSIECTTRLSGVAAPLRALTSIQYENSVRALFGDAITPSSAYPRPSGAPVTGFASDLSLNTLSAGFAEGVAAAADDVALQVHAQLGTLLPCSASGGESCAAQFVDTFAPRAFRRPLDPSERTALLRHFDVAMAAHGNFGVAIAELAALLLQHPRFVYLPEIGSSDAAGRKLDGYELASRLSYLLWDGPPDAALLKVAADGSLTNEATLRAEAERMVASPRFSAVLGRFVRAWIQLDHVAAGDKDPALYPELDGALSSAIADELDRFVRQAVDAGPGGFAALMAGRETEVNAPLAALYGASTSGMSADSWRTLTLGPERAGLLTRAAVLAGLSGPFEPSHVRRGRFVRIGLLCSNMGAPPANAMTRQPAYPAGASRRERSEILQKTSPCGGCHAQLDPIGLALDDFDALGRHVGGDVDVRGSIVGGGDMAGNFSGAAELSAMLADSETVKDCVGRHWFRYAFGRIETAGDACTLAKTAGELAKTEGDLAALFAHVALAPGFRFRTIAGE